MKAKETITMPKTEYVIEPGKQELISTVVLDAPRELVFRAYTDPKLFVQWWGPRRYENEIVKFDSRSGGEIGLGPIPKNPAGLLGRSSICCRAL